MKGALPPGDTVRLRGLERCESAVCQWNECRVRVSKEASF